MINFPLTAIIKKGCVVINTDMSYSDHVRKPNKDNLKQYRSDEYKEAIKDLNDVENLTAEYGNITNYVNKHIELHTLLQKENGQLNDEPNKKNDKDGENKQCGRVIRNLGVLSISQLRKIRSAVENMVATILLNYDYSKKPDENDKYLAFVTLTLPYAQMHTDAVLRCSLIKFIDNLRKTYGVEHYVWKAEAQKNGNIHFHLIIDKYIDMDDIKRLWNKQLSKLGYIQKYAEKRRKEGFIYKPFYMYKGVKVKSKKSYEEQKKYFEYEKSIGFSSPYSTEIKSLKDVSDTSAYIMKYMDKLELDKRPIIGKIWGCSNETKRLSYPKISECDPLFQRVMQMISKSSFKLVLKDDFFSVHAGKVHDVLKSSYTDIWSCVKSHYKKLFNFVSEPPNAPGASLVIAPGPSPVISPVVTPVVAPVKKSSQLKMYFGDPNFWSNVFLK
ncbi:rolling circle replication-associated protein [Tenacibaculum maritimum]|uniref:rolling circle replication-associated protein n=3 Tax=Tenacibaculum maritimum TaxID=107401 RepID=UPI001E60D07D|nr:hypothetical protein [Tenacibaculum maritimum]MCD9609790.1 hypothetical protein [Tenacibaculum maritimum]